MQFASSFWNPDPAVRLTYSMGGSAGSRSVRRTIFVPRRPSVPRPQKGKKLLRDSHVTEKVHLELAPQIVNGKQLERRRHRDSGIVDKGE